MSTDDSEAPLLLTIHCPVADCRAANSARVERCGACGAWVRAYGLLQAQSARLFNEGLSLARAGRLAEARERFAAVLCWSPQDQGARCALALACLESGDREVARSHWSEVPATSKAHEMARRGLASIATSESRRKPGPRTAAGRRRR